VAEDEWVTERWKVVLEDVQVGAADSAGEDLEEDVAGCGCRARHVFDGERGGVGAEEGGLHASMVNQGDPLPSILCKVFKILILGLDFHCGRYVKY